MDTEREELTSRRERLVSLDVLRGFDMFWIIGGKKIIVAISLLTSAQWVDWTLARMEHPEWNGFEPWDLIFPLFLFIAGVATPLAINHRRRRGDNDRKIYCHILLRGALLVALGIIYNGLPTDWTDSTGWQNHRYPSVLGRIGLAYMFAAIIVMRTELLGRLLWVVGLLLGYWAALRFIPVPEFGAGDWSPGHTLTDYLDRLMVPGTLYQGDRDPEGLGGVIPAIATALLGAITGQMLMRSDRSGIAKTLRMILGGAICLGLGWAWDQESVLQFPINKNLWSSSFVLYCAGWSLWLLALFYLVIDVWKWRWGTTFFMVIGANSIFIYMAPKFINFNFTADQILAGPQSLAPRVSGLILVLGVFAIKWLLLYLMYRKKIFLKI
jgi:predicted acyltransferase